MSLKLYRCVNPTCSETEGGGRPKFDFPSETGICPKCKADPSKLEFKKTVRSLAVIHYMTIDSTGPIVTRTGRRTITCQPTVAKVPKHATGSPKAVTCLLCHATEAYQKDLAAGTTQNDGQTMQRALDKAKAN